MEEVAQRVGFPIVHNGGLGNSQDYTREVPAKCALVIAMVDSGKLSS